MEARRQHQAALSRNALLVLLIGLFVWIGSPPASSHNVWKGGYRKWPWRAGADRTLTVLPGECPHCPGVQSSSAWKAIDAALNYEEVHSIGPGVIDKWETSGGGAGKYLRIKDDDGMYITYEHLSKALVTSGRVVPGQPIAVSGCTGNCSGPHLHFQRHDASSFQSNAKSLVPISGHGGSGDALTRSAYTSDNAGIGYNAKGGTSSKMQAVYRKSGGYDVVGVSANIGKSWSPCRTSGATGTWWRYYCSPRSGVAGGVQTFKSANEKYKAIMQREDQVHVLGTALLAAYTEIHDEHDWVYWMGYPNSDPIALSGGGYKQLFDTGTAYVYPATCIQDMFSQTYNKYKRYYYCD